MDKILTEREKRLVRVFKNAIYTTFENHTEKTKQEQMKSMLQPLLKASPSTFLASVERGIIDSNTDCIYIIAINISYRMYKTMVHEYNIYDLKEISADFQLIYSILQKGGAQK